MGPKPIVRRAVDLLDTFIVARARPRTRRRTGHRGWIAVIRGPQLPRHGETHEIGHVDVGPELLELARPLVGHDEADEEVDEDDDGHRVGPGALHRR